MKINWNELKKIDDPAERSEYIQAIIRSCAPDDPIFLTDCLIRAGAEGVYVLMELATQEKDALMNGSEVMKWKIQVLCDEWGHKPMQGDSTYKINKRSLKRNGKAIPAHEINTAILDGTYTELFEPKRWYPIDKKGCIECTFTDAAAFINIWGVHPVTKRPCMFNKRKETSGEPLDYDGTRFGVQVKKENLGKKHVHYWRYMEADKERYDGLPKLDKPNSSERGNTN